MSESPDVTGWALDPKHLRGPTRQETLDAIAWARGLWLGGQAAQEMLEQYNYEEGIRLMCHLAYALRFALGSTEWDELVAAINYVFDRISDGD